MEGLNRRNFVLCRQALRLLIRSRALSKPGCRSLLLVTLQMSHVCLVFSRGDLRGSFSRLAVSSGAEVLDSLKKLSLVTVDPVFPCDQPLLQQQA